MYGNPIDVVNDQEIRRRGLVVDKEGICDQK